MARPTGTLMLNLHRKTSLTWLTDDAEYDFRGRLAEGLSYTARKAPDRTFQFVLSGLDASPIDFGAHPLPRPGRAVGVAIAITWTEERATLRLGGADGLVEVASVLRTP